MRVEMSQVWKAFGDNQVLRGLDLVVPQGKIVCIVGGSGNGKSVTLKHIAGLLRPDSGSVRVDGQEITRLGERGLIPIRRRIGMVFQDGALLKSLTVGENVGLALREHRLAPRREIPGIVAEKLGLVGLEGIDRETPDSLSGGMRKRVATARALTTNPEIVLYDEPTAGLDPILASQIDELILDLNRRLGVTSVVVTHDMVTVFKIADVVNMIHRGRIIESGTPEEFRRSKVPHVVEFLKRDMTKP